MYAFIARLSAGVLPGEPGDRSAPNGGFSANGVTATGQNNFLLNGVDNNANVIDFFNQAAFVLAPAVDAIGEMKVMVNGYNAEYGRAAGGVVNVNIKSGTNKFHGSLFEYLQNAALNANKWESVRAGVPRGPYQQNQFGGSLGGPLIKNRTFWFFDYQGTRVNSQGGAIPGLGSIVLAHRSVAGIQDRRFFTLADYQRDRRGCFGPTGAPRSDLRSYDHTTGQRPVCARPFPEQPDSN